MNIWILLKNLMEENYQKKFVKIRYSLLRDEYVSDKGYEHIKKLCWLWHKGNGKLSWFVFEDWHFVVTKYILRFYR